MFIQSQTLNTPYPYWSSVHVVYEQQHSVADTDIQYLMGLDVEQVSRSSALFLLKLKEQRWTSQVIIDNIVEGCKGLFTQKIDHVQAGVRAKLADTIEGLDDIFKNVTDPFEGIETCHLQEKYFRETLGLTVSLLSRHWH